ncbi:MAG: GNAT family N-acetyltransferase [Oligoflexales bacterium]|nr:GNAT family N-acetyltransferase [Oligoflexales bacterium]
MSQIHQFVFPAPPSMFPDIESLLHQTLREPPIDYSILKEYPLVFFEQHSDKNVSGGSLVGRIDDTIATHLSLLIRNFVIADGTVVLRIGFVSNVATQPHWQKMGYMTATFKQLDSIAEKHDLDALLLWGDLSKFYQNLGYMSLGREQRYHLSRSLLTHYQTVLGELMQKRTIKTEVRQIKNAELSEEQFRDLNKLRPPQKMNCHRTVAEFRNLIMIPDTYIYCCFSGTTPVAYAVMGRGKDFIGVIHEWGSLNFFHLHETINTVFASSLFSEILLLSPADLPQEFSIGLRSFSEKIELLPMAMAKVFNSKIKAELEEIFVWGLDSI